MGYPAETEEDFIKTIQSIIRNNAYIDNFKFFPFELEKADIHDKKNVKLVNQATINRRLGIIAKIFKHQTKYYLNLLLEEDPIIYKEINSKYNSKIKINMGYYRKLLLNQNSI